jgi:hypothetical protein
MHDKHENHPSEERDDNSVNRDMKAGRREVTDSDTARQEALRDSLKESQERYDSPDRSRGGAER